MKRINWHYTIGEILIVIIGITIAFSMNKCADNSKNAAQKQQYLTNIKNDIEVDKLALEENLKTIQNKIDMATEVIPKLNSGAPDIMSVTGKIFNLVALTNFTPNDHTYQTLINSGDFKLIDDFELQTAIEKHYSTYQIIQKDYLRLENIQKQYIGDYFIYYTDFDDFTKGIFGFKDEKLLKNILLSMRGSFEMQLKASQLGIESCTELLEMLKKS